MSARTRSHARASRRFAQAPLAPCRLLALSPRQPTRRSTRQSKRPKPAQSRPGKKAFPRGAAAASCHGCGVVGEFRLIGPLQGRICCSTILSPAVPVPYCEAIDTERRAMARDLDPHKLSTPRIFLVRMMVFLILCSLVVVVLYKQILTAFMANPGLNALIVGVMLIGVALAFRQVGRLFREINWVNGFRLDEPGLAVDHTPVLLAHMAALLGDRLGRVAISSTGMGGFLYSIAAMLDEARDLSRYMTGLLIFLGLLGTFWGLIDTVSSVGKVLEGLKVGGDAGATFEALKEGLAAPLSGMG